MTIDFKHIKTISAEEAEQYGFNIEGTDAFFFDLGCTVAVMGFNTLNGVWQFDTGVSDTGDTWQFVEPNLYVALQRAMAVEQFMQGATRFLTLSGAAKGDIDFVGILDQAFEGCSGVLN